MSGETKQMIANVRKELQFVLNRIEEPGEDPEAFIDDLVERIEKFNQFLIDLDVPVPHQVPPLGLAVTDDAPPIDRFGGGDGGPKPSDFVPKFTTTSNPTPVDDGQPGIVE